jgi:hypothetical protein
MMNPTKIKEQAETMSLVEAREAQARIREHGTGSDAEWETLIAAERVLGKWGELKYATYNED